MVKVDVESTSYKVSTRQSMDAIVKFRTFSITSRDTTAHLIKLLSVIRDGKLRVGGTRKIGIRDV